MYDTILIYSSPSPQPSLSPLARSATTTPATTGIKKSLSDVSLGGIVDSSNPRQKRIKVFSEEQRAAINDLQSPNEIPHDERKRGYAALQRRLKQPGLPDGCVEQWKAAKTTRQKSFSQISLCANFRDVYIGLYQ